MNNLNSMILTLAVAILATPLRAGTVLTFDVTSHTAKPEGAKQGKGQSLPADAKYTLTVTLSGDAMQIDEPDTVSSFDFKNARITRLDKKTKLFSENSLYTFLGFNVAEFANRMMLGGVLAAAKLKDNPMTPALTENLMSMSDPANATVIDTGTKGDETFYSWNGHPLVTTSTKVRELPAAEMAQYLRFLRYSVGGHPKILAAIEQGRGVPERLTIVRSNVSTETRTLILRSVDNRPDSPMSLSGYTRESPDRQPFMLLKRLTSLPADELETHVAVLRQERDAASAAGHTLDAMLANFAAMLSTGDGSEATAWIAAHNGEIGANTDAQRLMRSLNPTDEASAKQAADALEELKSSAGAHGYVLSIFAANIRLSLHQGDKAINLFLAALTADPTITGAWIDLGTVYYSDFDAEAAWACWDAARSLRPAHFMLKKVDDREHKLRADHPEFF